VNRFISIRAKKYYFDIEDIFSINGDIPREIIIVSAYFDLDSIDFVYKFANKNPNIIIEVFIDKYSSRIFSDDEINKKLISSPKNVDIFLVKYGKLFHSKLYYLQGDKRIKVYIGSLNFTFNAFNRNEEILSEYIENIEIKSQYILDIKEYIETLKQKSEKVTEKIEKSYRIDDLRSLILNGYIYFEIKEGEYFNFNFDLKLPNNVNRVNIDIKKFPMLETKLSSFLKLEKMIFSNEDLKKKIEESFPNKRVKKKKYGWKSYCIETCYGYWTPSYFKSDLEKVLEKRRREKELHINKVKFILENYEREIYYLFVDFYNSLKRELIKKEVNSWIYMDEYIIKRDWEKWIDKLIIKLNNPKFYKRITHEILNVTPPDVWSDPIASKEFEDSFLESILYNILKDKTYNKISNAIKKELKENKVEIEEEILKRKIEYLLLEYGNSIFMKIKDS